MTERPQFHFLGRAGSLRIRRSHQALVMQMPCGHVQGKSDVDTWSLLNSEQVACGGKSDLDTWSLLNSEQVACGGKSDLDTWSPLLNTEQVAQGKVTGQEGQIPWGLVDSEEFPCHFHSKGGHCRGPKSKCNKAPLPPHCVSPAQRLLWIHASQDCRFPGHRDVGPAPPISVLNYYL